MRKKLLFFAIAFPFLLFFGDALAAERIIYSDFEESGNSDETVWTHYIDRGFIEDIAGKRNRFMLDSENPFEGYFSVRSMNPNEKILNDYDSDSFFVVNASSVFGRNMTYGDELLIKYAAKFPTDWEGEATDYENGGHASDGGANHLRINGNNNRSIEATFGGGWLNSSGSFHWYDAGGDWLDFPVYLEDEQWHQYSLYIKMPSSSTVPDGLFRIWRDNGNDYSPSLALFSKINVVQTEDFYRIAVATPCYYKGEVTAKSVDGHVTSGNWTFWLDNIEIWDGIPNEKIDMNIPLIPVGLAVN